MLFLSAEVENLSLGVITVIWGLAFPQEEKMLRLVYGLCFQISVFGF